MGLPGSSGGCWSGPSLDLKLLWLAHASIKVPSTVKCSVESRSRLRACSTTSANKVLATSAANSRSRFLVNIVRSQTGSSMFIPTNQRNSSCSPVAPSIRSLRTV